MKSFLCKRKRSAIKELFDDLVIITKNDARSSLEVQAHLEIELCESFYGQKFHGNPLDLYKEHQGKFPSVTSWALKYLCGPGSSVPSERICCRLYYQPGTGKNKSWKSRYTYLFTQKCWLDLEYLPKSVWWITNCGILNFECY